MATTKIKGQVLELFGEMPSIGSQAPDFALVNSNLIEVLKKDFEGKNVILNIFPSIDTPVCALSVRMFNNKADKLPDTNVLAVSHDLPFALKRYCAAEGLENIISLSAFRNPEFGKSYGVLITSGPMKGLLARAVVIINKHGEIIYKELVSEITIEPNYEAALAALK